MSIAKDIIDLAKDLQTRMKDRRDIDTLKQIRSLAFSLQSVQLDIVERDIKLLQENAELKAQLTKSQDEQTLNDPIDYADTNSGWSCASTGCKLDDPKRTLSAYRFFERQKVNLREVVIGDLLKDPDVQELISACSNHMGKDAATNFVSQKLENGVMSQIYQRAGVIHALSLLKKNPDSYRVIEIIKSNTIELSLQQLAEKFPELFEGYEDVNALIDNYINS